MNELINDFTFNHQVESMDIRNITKKAQKRRDSIIKDTKMNHIKSINFTIAKRKKVIIRNMAANMNTMNQRKVNTRKAKNMILASMKDTKVKQLTIK